MSDTRPGIVWFRSDLRLADQAALRAGAAREGGVIPVFIWSPEEEGEWAAGAASRWWLHQSLVRLENSLRELGLKLIVRKGNALEVLRELVKETGAGSVFWNRRYEPMVMERDGRVREGLRKDGVEVGVFSDALLFDPGAVRTKEGRAYTVFTAFWKNCLGLGEPRETEDGPGKMRGVKKWPGSMEIRELGLERRLDWGGEMKEAWEPGEIGAKKQLAFFLKGAAGGYDKGRDVPGEVGTSRLSPHLHFGEISVREVWHAVRGKLRGAKEAERKSLERYCSELGWREFANYLLVHFPETPERPLREAFAKFPWMENERGSRAWQKGMTGYPIVDAGMRELWHTGWMHNRVRMIVASFLVKDLLVPWQVGAKWFWETLVDADLANNTLGWQWTAGCGADAAPYFRVFNPVLQGEKFDAEGAYVRKWVPELNRLPDRWIHKPWEAPVGVLAEAGVTLGETYPQPIVDHGEARERALKAFSRIKK